MLKVDSEKIYIEHCINCKSHNWCTSHNEEKYKEWFSRCQTVILKSCYNVTVVENIIPEAFTHLFLTDPNTSKPGKLHFPRIGSFEVYFRGSRIFSKIESMKWPNPTAIAEKIKEIQTAPQKNPKVKKQLKGVRVKSALAKRKKLKKTKKKSQRKKIKKLSFDSSEKEEKRKKFDEIFKSRSSDSSGREKANYTESHTPYEHYKNPISNKTPPRRLDSFGQDKSEEGGSDFGTNREVKKEGEKGKGKNESSSYSRSESYESNPEIEKIDFAGRLGQANNSSEYEEYKSEDYEKYQDNSESEEYEDDYDESKEKNRSNYKKSISVVKDSESESSKKSSYSSGKKSSGEDYSEDKDYEDEYDQDFNDEDSSDREDIKERGKKAQYY